jgi:hypothetical protein
MYMWIYRYLAILYLQQINIKIDEKIKYTNSEFIEQLMITIIIIGFYNLYLIYYLVCRERELCIIQKYEYIISP